MQDAYLPQRLVDKLMYMYNYVEMARVTGVPMSFLLTRGQSIKVFSQILRKARQRNLLVPNLKVSLRSLFWRASLFWHCGLLVWQSLRSLSAGARDTNLVRQHGLRCPTLTLYYAAYDLAEVNWGLQSTPAARSVEVRRLRRGMSLLTSLTLTRCLCAVAWPWWRWCGI